MRGQAYTGAEADEPLREGEIIHRSSHGGARFRVDGYTTRGKLRLVNTDTGSVSTYWWHKRGDLPQGYRVERGIGKREFTDPGSANG